MKQRFPYLVTRSPDIGKERFETALREEVFPQVELPSRRNLRITDHDLRDLGVRGGRSEYLWLVDADLFGGTIEAPALLALQAALGTLGKVTGPIVLVTVDQSQAIIDPQLVRVASGGRMIWSFSELPPNHTAIIDFVAYRPLDSKAEPSGDFEPPFEELTVGPGTVTGSYATGPEGHYWYTVSLVPARQTDQTEIKRLECAHRSWFQGRHAAGLEVETPPARGGG